MSSGNTITTRRLYSQASAKRKYNAEKMARVIPHPQHSTPKTFVKIHILLPLYTPSSGIAYIIIGRSIRSNSLTQFDRISFRIGKVSNQYHNEVY